MQYWFLEKSINLEDFKENLAVDEFRLDLNIYFSNVHIYTKDSMLYIKVFSEIKELESLSILPERTRSNFLVAIWILSFFTGQPFDILDSQNYISAYNKEGNNSVENKNLLIFNWINFTKDIGMVIDILDKSSYNEKILIYSLLDRLRKANFLSKESLYTPLYFEESILSSFHILELMSDIYSTEYNALIENRVKLFLKDLSNIFYYTNENDINFIDSKKKLCLEIIDSEIWVKNKIMFLLEKLDLFNDKIKYFIKEATEMRNWIAHGRSAYVEKTIIPLPVFFPLNKNPFFHPEDILIFVSRVIAKYLWLSLYNDAFESLINDLPISLDSTKNIVLNKDYEKYSDHELECFIYDLNLFFLQTKISSKKLSGFINFIIGKSITERMGIDMQYLLIWNFKVIEEDKRNTALNLIKNLEKSDLRDILLELEAKNIDITDFKKIFFV